MGLLAAAGGIRKHVHEAVLRGLFGQNQFVVFGNAKPVGFSLVINQNFLTFLE
jgi:hypothetical protein